MTANSLSMMLKRLGRKVLDIHLHPHMLRHTSATYYAPLLDRTTYCKRFGWAFSSNMPDRYIDWAQIEEKKTVEAVRELDGSHLEEENRDLRTTVEQLRAQQAQIAQNMAKINGFMEKLVENPKLQEQLEAMMKKAAQVGVEEEAVEAA